MRLADQNCGLGGSNRNLFTLRKHRGSTGQNRHLDQHAIHTPGHEKTLECRRSGVQLRRTMHYQGTKPRLRGLWVGQELPEPCRGFSYRRRARRAVTCVTSAIALAEDMLPVMNTDMAAVELFEQVRDPNENVLWAGRPAFLPFLASGIPFLMIGLIWFSIDFFGFIRPMLFGNGHALKSFAGFMVPFF